MNSCLPGVPGLRRGVSAPGQLNIDLAIPRRGRAMRHAHAARQSGPGGSVPRVAKALDAPTRFMPVRDLDARECTAGCATVRFACQPYPDMGNLGSVPRSDAVRGGPPSDRAPMAYANIPACAAPSKRPGGKGPDALRTGRKKTEWRACEAPRLMPVWHPRAPR